MKYLRIKDGSFGFVVDGIHEIITSDIEISDEAYNEFFQNQNNGKNYRLKTDRTSENDLFDYVEEYEIIPQVFPKTKMEILQDDLLSTRIAMAELIEMIMTEGGGTE